MYFAEFPISVKKFLQHRFLTTLFQMTRVLPIFLFFFLSDEGFILLQVAAQKQTLKSVTDYITDIICKRAELGFNYGVILIPEGLIDFIPEVSKYPSPFLSPFMFCNGAPSIRFSWMQKCSC